MSSASSSSVNSFDSAIAAGVGFAIARGFAFALPASVGILSCITISSTASSAFNFSPFAFGFATRTSFACSSSSDDCVTSAASRSSFLRLWRVYRSLTSAVRLATSAL